MNPPKGYKYLSLLGKGQATTWLAESNDDGQEVVIKTLELKNVSDWKGIELFEREVKVLQQLDHPSIPKFIDFIKDEHEGAKRWHIVQEKVEGEKLDPTSSWSEEDLRALAKSVLESLVYLQSFSPPLLHRDIKPDNLIRKEKGYALIDFGSVRHVIPSDVGGSTVVGTSGYMAPEQLMGRADKSSDLYGLGMTLIHSISGKHPDDLGKKRMHVQWSDYQNKLSEDFVEFVNRLTEPHAENRFESATEAYDVLLKPIGPPKNLIRDQKSWVKISWHEDNSELRVRGMQFIFLGRQGYTVTRALFVSLSVVPFLIFIGLELGGVPFLFVTCVSLYGFISSVHLKVHRINTTIGYTENGIETLGTGLILLSKTDRRRVDDEMHKLSLRYLESSGGEHAELALGIEHEKKVVNVNEERN